MSWSEFTIQGPLGNLHARALVPPAPRRTDGRVSVFVLCHGLLDNIQAPVFPFVQDVLAQLDISSVAFDFHGNGQSTGTTTYGNYYDEAEDIRTVVESLNGRGIPSLASPCAVVGALGHSKGASSLLLFANKYKHLCPQLLVTLSARYWLAREITMRWTDQNQQDLAHNGRFLWRRYGKKPSKSNGNKIEDSAQREEGPVKEYWVSLDDMKDRSATDMSVIQGLPLHRCAVLNIMGSRDEVVPEDDVWEYHRLMRLAAPANNRVVTRIVPRASHFWKKHSELRPLDLLLRRWLSKTMPRPRL
ncbi:hypothetical protein GGF46_001479 [Coemansia sp. RSA 552]|nr:hypothetical protein GGF46_001479 [Coemansia sp. RSA 552]